MNTNIAITILIYYFAVVSLISILVTVIDKYKAIHHKWRIKESTLLVLSALGGSAAMYITMLTIRHKTKKLKFMLGIPLIMLAQALVIFAAFWVTKNAWG